MDWTEEVSPVLLGSMLAAVLAAAGMAFTYHEGDKAGADRVQVLWDADHAKGAKALADATAAAAAQHVKDLEINDQVTHDLQAKAAASDASATTLATSLHNYQTQHASRCPVQPVPNTPAGTPTTAPEPAGGDAVAGAIATYTKACAADAAHYEALEQWVTDHLPK